VVENIYKRKLNWAEESIGAVAAKEEEGFILETPMAAPCSSYGKQHSTANALRLNTALAAA